MIQILIIGAKLQGIEAMYLARKAGFYIIAVDHNENAPGADLADEFIKADVYDEKRMLSLFSNADVVLPVIEDSKILTKVNEYGIKTGTNVIFDFNAYHISCSKEKSNELFLSNQLPVPRSYPDCEYPVILKPDGKSGSSNVVKAYNAGEVEEYLKINKNDKTVIQEYLQGRSYSIEVVGDGTHFYYPQITEVVVDKQYDCKRIIAPANIKPFEEEQMITIAQKLANSLKINGIFDIEVISDDGKLKILEIDARLPSQTPISIYHSTGINIVEMMTNLTLGNVEKDRMIKPKRTCFYQQIQVRNGTIQVLGEHIMGSCRHLRIIKDFFGSTEAITDYQEGSIDWKAIIIVTGKDEKQASENFLLFIQNMKEKTGIQKWKLIEG